MKSKICLTESFVFTPMLVESSDGGGVVARGQFGKADIPTANRRIYPRSLYERELKVLHPKMKENQVFGELDHPGDGQTKLQRVSHLVTRAEMLADGRIMGEAKILPDTRNGKQLIAILKNGGKVGISSRGFGSVQVDEEGYDVVQDDFQLLTWDFVADPAAGGSYPEFTTESKSTKDGIVFVEAAQNKGWGFYGTLKSNYQLKDSEAAKVFAHAEKQLSKLGKVSIEQARDFLDSKDGRHVADDLSFQINLGDEPDFASVIKAFDIGLKKSWYLKSLKTFMKDYNPEDFKEEIDMARKIRKGSLKTEGFKQEQDTDQEDTEKDTVEEEVTDEDGEEEESEDKMEALVSKIRKEESQKMVSKLGEMIDGLKESLREEIRSELESDPKIAGAKLAIESVKKLMRPYIIGEDVSEEIGARESQIEGLQTELKARDAQLGEYASITKELGYKLRVEQRIADYPSKKEIRQRIGDVTRFESLKHLDAKLEKVLSAVKEQESRFESKVQAKEGEVKVLKERVKTLEESYKKALKIAENFGIQAYVEKKLAGNPHSTRIKKIVENRGITKTEDVDSLVEQFKTLKTSGTNLRDKIQGRFKGVRSSTLVEDQIKETMPKNRSDDVEIAPGVTLSEVKRLS